MKWYQAGLNCVGAGVLIFVAGDIAIAFKQFSIGKPVGYLGLGLIGLGIALVVVSWFRRK